MEFTYSVIFEPAEEGGYVVHVPTLNDSVTQGETLEEAHERARSLIRSRIEALIALGRPIPKEITPDPQGEQITATLAVTVA